MKKRAIFIEANRNGYHPRQCGRTLTAEELLSAIEECANALDDEDKIEVYISNDNGYTYGSIDWGDIFAAVYDDDMVYREGDDGFMDAFDEMDDEDY